MQARDLMSTNLVVVPPETPVAALSELLAARAISAVPVIDITGAPVGIVTEGDLIRRLADEVPTQGQWLAAQFKNSARLAKSFTKAHGATARDVMTTGLVTVKEDASVEEVARLMEQRQIRRVLVLRDGVLVGLISRADLLRSVLAPRPPAAAQDDAAIMRAVFAAMREQPWTDMFLNFPSVRDGVVTWFGYARSDELRAALRVLAELVPGVTRVVDEMKTMPAILRLTL